MSKEIHIDQYLKEKINLLSIPYEESYWLDAEKLIISADKAKRRRFIFWIFLITIISVLAIIYAVISSPNSFKYVNSESNEYQNKTKLISIVKPSVELNSTSVKGRSFKNKKVKSDLEKVSKNRSLKFQTKKSKNLTHDGKLFKRPNLEKHSNGELTSKDSIAVLSTSNSELLDSLIKLNSYQIEVPHEYNLWLTEEENERKYKRNKAFIGFSAGINFNPKMQTAYFASIHLQKILTKKWSVRLGSQVSALKFPHLVYNYTTTDYSFGALKTNTEIKSDLIYSLQIPLTFHYRIYKFHTGFAGIGYSRYLAQKNIISSTINDIKSTSSEFGTTDKFKMNNYFVNFGYETIVWRKYQIGVSTNIPINNSISKYSEMRTYLLYNFMSINR